MWFSFVKAEKLLSCCWRAKMSSWAGTQRELGAATSLFAGA